MDGTCANCGQRGVSGTERGTGWRSYSASKRLRWCQPDRGCWWCAMEGCWSACSGWRGQRYGPRGNESYWFGGSEKTRFKCYRASWRKWAGLLRRLCRQPAGRAGKYYILRWQSGTRWVSLPRSWAVCHSWAMCHVFDGRSALKIWKGNIWEALATYWRYVCSRGLRWWQ